MDFIDASGNVVSSDSFSSVATDPYAGIIGPAPTNAADLSASYAGPTIDEITQAAQSAGLSIPNVPQPSASMLSSSYWQQKIADFQSTLSALDQGYQAAILAQNSPDALQADPDLGAFLDQWLSDFDSKRAAFRVTAEAINGGAALVNAVGGNFQPLNIPATLGIAPAIVVPIAWAAAFAVAATLIAWGVTALQGLNQRLARAQQLAVVANNPQASAALAQSFALSDNAAQQASSTGFASIATFLKWGAIIGGGFLLWRAFGGSKLLAGLDTISAD